MVFGNLGRMLAAAAGERDGSILAAVFESGLRGRAAVMGNACLRGRSMTRAAAADASADGRVRVVVAVINVHFHEGDSNRSVWRPDSFPLAKPKETSFSMIFRTA